MARGLRNAVKMEQISIRLPVDLLNDLDKLKLKEQMDRSTIIVKALRYWVSVEGKITTDNEFITKIKEINLSIDELKKSMNDKIAGYEKESSENRNLLAEQQKTINTLLRMIPKEE